MEDRLVRVGGEGRKERRDGREQDKNESERQLVGFPKKKVHVGTAAAALGNNLAAPWLAIATRLEQIELVVVLTSSRAQTQLTIINCVAKAGCLGSAESLGTRTEGLHA